MATAHSRQIALLVDHVESHYHQEVVMGALRAARAAQVRLLVVAGGWLGRPPEEPLARNFIYDLVAEAKLDGLVVLGGSLSNFCGVDRFVQWLSQFARLPSVTIGLELPEIATVRTDNEVGVHALVSHLIETHQRRKIGFLRGPRESSEAEARFRAYCQALADHGIDVEDRLVVLAGLGRDCGMTAITELFDRRHLGPPLLDAIVAVNDDVARGALEELKRRSIVVPDQLAIVGFDDAVSARAATPPLTTVNQCVEQQAYVAVQRVIEAINNDRKPVSEVLQSQPVYRASCGCAVVPAQDTAAGHLVAPGLARSLRLALVERRGSIAAELSRAAAGRVSNAVGWESQLLDSLSRDMTGESPGDFLRTIVLIARRHAAAARDIVCFHDVLSSLRSQVLSLSVVEPDMRPRLEDLFQDVRFALAQLGVDVERSRQEMLNLRVRLVTKECLALFGSGKVETLVRALDEHMPALGIEAYIVSRFQSERGISAELEPIARRSTGLWHVQSHSVGAKDLGIDPVLAQQDVLLIEPLEFDGFPMGIAVFAWGAQVTEHYEQLREVLSAAMRAIHPARPSTVYP